VAIRFEYYNTGDDGDFQFYGASWAAQTFVPSKKHTILSVKLKLYRVNSPNTVTVGIRFTDGDGKPTGDDLCSGTTDGNTLTTDSAGEWREITLDTGYNLNVNIKYGIVVRVPNATSGNYLRWREDCTGTGYINGYGLLSGNSGSTWTAYTDIDCMFEEWGEKQAPLPMHFRS